MSQGAKKRDEFIFDGVIKGLRKNITPITTSSYIATKTDYIIELDATSNTIIIELPEPSTDYDGQEYVLDAYNADNTITIASFDSTLLDIDTITDQGGNTWRYTMNGTPDLSGVIIGQYIKVASATNAANDGYFVVTAVNDGSDYIEVTNASGIAEATDSPATLQLEVFSDATMVVNETRTYVCYNHRNYWRRIN